MEDLIVYFEKKTQLEERAKTFEWQPFAEVKEMASNVPVEAGLYIRLQNLLPVIGGYYKLYDYLQTPPLKEIMTAVEEEGIKADFESERCNYKYFETYIKILRTKGYKYLKLLSGKEDKEIIDACDLEITNDRISFDSYIRIKQTMNNGIEKLIALYPVVRNPENYRRYHLSEYAMKCASDDELYPSKELVAPIFMGITQDNASLQPTEKQLEAEEEQIKNASQDFLEIIGKELLKKW